MFFKCFKFGIDGYSPNLRVNRTTWISCSVEKCLFTKEEKIKRSLFTSFCLMEKDEPLQFTHR